MVSVENLRKPKIGFSRKLEKTENCHGFYFGIGQRIQFKATQIYIGVDLKVVIGKGSFLAANIFRRGRG